MPSSRVSNPTDLDQEKLQILLNQINLLSTKMDSVFKSRERMLSALEIRLTLFASKMPGRPSSLIPNSCPVLSETTVPSIVKPDTKTTIVIYQSEDMVPSTPTDPFTPNVYTNPEILTHLSCFDTTDHSIVTPTSSYATTPSEDTNYSVISNPPLHDNRIIESILIPNPNPMSSTNTDPSVATANIPFKELDRYHHNPADTTRIDSHDLKTIPMPDSFIELAENTKYGGIAVTDDSAKYQQGKEIKDSCTAKALFVGRGETYDGIGHVDSISSKAGGKAKKYVHAFGIQPLWSMDRATATALSANTVIESSQYIDEGYRKDGIHSSPGETGDCKSYPQMLRHNCNGRSNILEVVILIFHESFVVFLQKSFLRAALFFCILKATFEHTSARKRWVSTIL